MGGGTGPEDGSKAAGDSQELGITGNMPARWKRNEKGWMKAFTGEGNVRAEKTTRLRKENAGLWETNEILKKATAIFTARNPR
jgi:transposase-like protein